jgi:hypothetical protein
MFSVSNGQTGQATFGGLFPILGEGEVRGSRKPTFQQGLHQAQSSRWHVAVFVLTTDRSMIQRRDDHSEGLDEQRPITEGITESGFSVRPRSSTPQLPIRALKHRNFNSSGPSKMTARCRCKFITLVLGFGHSGRNTHRMVCTTLRSGIHLLATSNRCAVIRRT